MSINENLYFYQLKTLNYLDPKKKDYPKNDSEIPSNQYILNKNTNEDDKRPRQVLDDFNISQSITNKYSNDISLNQQTDNEELTYNKYKDSFYNQDGNNEEYNEYYNNQNEVEDISGHNENKQYCISNQNLENQEESNYTENYNEQNERNNYRLYSNLHTENERNIDISKIIINANDNHQGANIMKEENNYKKTDPKKINNSIINEISYLNNQKNNNDHNENFNENLIANEKSISQLNKEKNNNKNYSSYVDNAKNNKLKINLDDYSKEELELLEILSTNNSIKIENEEYFRNMKNEILIKIDKTNLQNKDFGFNLHHIPFKRDSFLNDKDKSISIEINNFKSILYHQIQEKNEKDFEIKNLKEIIQNLNTRLVSNDEIIKKNINLNNKYNELLDEFCNIQEHGKKIANENLILKKSINEIQNLNEIILKNYQNKLYDIGDYSNRLFSIYFSENENSEKN